MSEIVYTYNHYALNEKTITIYTGYSGSVFLNSMSVEKYALCCYIANADTTPEYYYGGFVWNETTEGDVITYKDVYFVAYGIKQVESSDFVITNCHYYKCNTESTGLKFKAKTNAAGIVSLDETKMIFGIDDGFFHIPPKSFFLEGDHQPFNDLKPGKYRINGYETNLN